MLTADLAQNWRRGDQVRPVHVHTDDPDRLADAAQLIKLFAEHEGRPRRELDTALEEYVGTGTNYKFLRGLIKLLTDRCGFEIGGTRDPVELRRALFLKARERHPVTSEENARGEVITEAARELGVEPDLMMRSLYADLPENQLLAAFNHVSAAELLNLYNLAQAQALLYHCVEMRLKVGTQDADSYRELFSAVKSYRLIHTIKGNPREGYEVRLDGPVSLFQRSKKYGVQMAVFLPALLLCKNWHMRAEIAQQSDAGRGNAYFELSSNQKRLNSHYLTEAPQEKSVGEKLVASWGRVETAWRLEPCHEVIDLGESAFIPDFVLTRDDGQKFYLEILGFWTPQHLQQRLAEFEHARFENFILAAWDELRGSRDPLTRPPRHTLVFKRSLDPVALELAAEELINAGEVTESC
jgi:predicted nuclease of restriction endonuclease-like RecB superfamily